MSATSRTSTTSSAFFTRVSSSRVEHPVEQREGAGLVQRLVEVPALRALHARRAAALARTPREQACGVLDPPLEDVEAALRDPDAAGVAVVDEDRRLSCLVVQVGRE